MDRYIIGRKIGEGSFGKVFYATKKRTGEERAIKCIRGVSSWMGIHRMRELQSILRIPKHPNVVQLFEVHREHNGLVRFVFEYMPTGSLLDLMERHIDQKLGPPLDMEVRSLVYQILRGVQHLHLHGIFHRDIKPENILLAGRVCKVADFSLACEQEEEGPPTSYISTRWYRAPEILLASKKYSSAVDIWAVGCIAAELYQLKPLFPGCDEIDQLRLIFQAMGTPKMVGWDEGTILLQALRVLEWTEPVDTAVDARVFLQSVLTHTNGNGVDAMVVDFLWTLLMLDPAKRIDATAALSHHIFDDIGKALPTNSNTWREPHQPPNELRPHFPVRSNTSKFTTSSPAMSTANVATISPPPLEDIPGKSLAGTKRNHEDSSPSLPRNPYTNGKRRQRLAP